MKKFYIPTLLAAFFLSSFYSQGQTYTSITSNPTNLTFDDPNFWLGHVAPPSPCIGCTIIIQSNVSMVQSGSSTANPSNTIFTGQTPTAAPVSIGQGVTLGTKFQSDIKGFVTGVRFYKNAFGSTLMGSSHIGLLYQLSPTITLLGQVNFTNETASGWQDAKFSSPIPVNANVNYMIAYFVPASDGYFEIDNNYFTSPVTNGHLTSPQNSATFGANGQFETGNSPTFPDLDPFVVSGGTFSAVNQWVDVDFNPVNLNDVVFNNSTIKIIGVSTVVNINTYVELFGSSIVVATDPTTPAILFVNDQLDVDSTTHSFIQIGNNFSYINANNDLGNTVIGPHPDFANGGIPDAGIYNIEAIDGQPYSLILNANGNGAALHGFAKYTINCGGPAGCNSGVINGPAITGSDPALVNGIIFGTSVILPVQLVQFIATKNDDGSVKVSWATAQEQNSDFYDVERSSDQTGWASIGTVKAKGFSSTTSNYFLTDKSPLSGTGYYRLKMVDLDGKFKYSPTVAVTTDKNSLPLVIYSNPFFDQIRLKINLSRPQNLTMTVSDMQGKTYITQSYQAQSGDNFVNIQPSVTSSGMYILRIQGDTYSQTVKLEKQ